MCGLPGSGCSQAVPVTHALVRSDAVSLCGCIINRTRFAAITIRCRNDDNIVAGAGTQARLDAAVPGTESIEDGLRSAVLACVRDCVCVCACVCVDDDAVHHVRTDTERMGDMDGDRRALSAGYRLLRCAGIV